MKFVFNVCLLFVLLGCNSNSTNNKNEPNPQNNDSRYNRYMELTEKENLGKTISVKEALELGKFYEDGDVVSVNHEKAEEWFTYAIINDKTPNTCNYYSTLASDPALLPKQKERWKNLVASYCDN